MISYHEFFSARDLQWNRFYVHIFSISMQLFYILASKPIGLIMCHIEIGFNVACWMYELPAMFKKRSQLFRKIVARLSEDYFLPDFILLYILTPLFGYNLCWIVDVESHEILEKRNLFVCFLAKDLFFFFSCFAFLVMGYFRFTRLLWFTPGWLMTLKFIFQLMLLFFY